MKLPAFFDSLTDKFKKKTDVIEVFLSLIIDKDHIAGACWYIDSRKNAQLMHAVAKSIDSDSWDEKLAACDEVISTLENKVPNREFRKVIFGLPDFYLNSEGDIKKEIRTHLKKITSELALEAIGFVPIHQAIVYRYKKDEGIPPSLILIRIYDQEYILYIYKVGKLSQIVDIPRSDNFVTAIEQAFKKLKDIEVLPSRILIYGTSQAELEKFKAEMIRHPWPKRANFIHFPKISSLSSDVPVVSVSLAGAGELMMNSPDILAGEAEEENIDTEISQSDVKSPENPDSSGDTEDDAVISESGDDAGESGPDEENEPEKNLGAASEKEEVQDGKADRPAELESNIKIVSPEEVGFKEHTDIIETHEQEKSREFPDNVKDEQFNQDKNINSKTIPEQSHRKQVKSHPNRLLLMFKKTMRLLKSGSVGRGKLYISAGFLLIVFFALAYWLAVFVLPRADVEIKANRQQISASASATMDKDVSEVNVADQIIPAIKLEKTVSGEKTIKVSGKKEEGDPAKGTITIYNKSLSSRVFKKGAVVSSGSVDFTLDEEVKVASASESIGSITFGKEDAQVTAKKIGTQGNLPANSEFTFADVSSGIAAAQNEEAFSGGNSREVTVVTRADYNKLIDAITPELVKKAKDELSQGVSAGQKLIDETIETDVTKKDFFQELDEKASELKGKITITVSGLAYKTSDLAGVLEARLKSIIPQGYKLDESTIDVKYGIPQITKSKILLKDAEIKALAIPDLKDSEIAASIAGKTDTEATEYLKNIPGISNVSVQHKYSLFSDKLPIEGKNIKISISYQN